MKTIDVNVPAFEKKYPIIIGSNVLSEIQTHIDISHNTKIVIITDSHIAPHFLSRIKSSIPHAHEIIIKPGEKEKNIETVISIWKELANKQFDRQSLVVNLGGGVIGDMGGFAASTYMRGIPFIQIPTTLLAQVDASIGGKVGIDFEGLKNTIGSFQQPRAVIIDIDTLTTLPNREFHAGFAEIIKHGLIAGAAYFEMVTGKKPREFTSEQLVEIICGSCEIKKRIVEEDPHENGVRKILNFGHTVGHAIESLSLETKSPLLHGEAISIGMIAEAKISELLGYISEEDFSVIKDSLVTANLPVTVKGMSYDKILHKMSQDKKNVKGKIKWTLLRKIGEADFNIEVNEKFMKQAVEYVLN